MNVPRVATHYAITKRLKKEILMIMKMSSHHLLDRHAEQPPKKKPGKSQPKASSKTPEPPKHLVENDTFEIEVGSPPPMKTPDKQAGFYLEKYVRGRRW